MAPIHKVPELCLFALFQNMTPVDQMDARKVCRQWANLVPVALRKAPEKRQALRLLVSGATKNDRRHSEEWFNEANCSTWRGVKLLKNSNSGRPMFTVECLNKWNSLMVESLDEATIAEIVDTFPGTNELQIALDYVPETQLDFVAQLLDKYRNQLISLKLFEDTTSAVEPDQSDAITARFYEALTSLTALKHLTLRLDSQPHDSGLGGLISHLETLNFNSYKASASEIIDMLQGDGGTSSSLKQIRLECNGVNVDVLEQFCRLPEVLRDRFTAVRFYWNVATSLERFCGHFRSLTTLKLAPVSISVRHLFTHLSKLKQLAHLRLILHASEMKPDAGDRQNSSLLPQVKSIKLLEIYLHMESHEDLSLFHFDWTTPNIEVLELMLNSESKCSACGIEKPTFGGHTLAGECLRKLLRPLKMTCDKLKLLLHNFEDTLGTAEQLFGEE